MRAVVNRLTGDVLRSPDASYASDTLTVYGRVDRLHTETAKIWNPSWAMIERFLACQSPASLPKNVINIEGAYLIIYQAGGNVYIFCDRFCFYRAYYRITPTAIELFDTLLGSTDNLVVHPAEAAAFVLYRYIPGRRTLFDGINMVTSGECLVYDSLSDALHIEVKTVYPKIERPELSEPEAAKTFHQKFMEHLDVHVRGYPDNEPLLLPLSGGFDSRYLLGAVLELVPPARIVSLTFGTPGSFDFEIGQQVAKAAGVRHIACALSPADYSSDDIARNSQDVDGQISVSIETPLQVMTRLAEYGKVVLSGHPGGGPLGTLARHEAQLDPRALVLEDALVKASSPLAQYVDQAMVEESFEPLNRGGDSPLQPFEHWFFNNHVPKYSVPCVYKLRQQLEYISPFADYDFSDFTFNLPPEMRIGRKLYFYWLGQHYPALSALPFYSFNGLPLTANAYLKLAAKVWTRLNRKVLGINRQVNKIDFVKYRPQLLDLPRLERFAADIFPAGFTAEVFRSPGDHILLLYNLRSLEILRSHWNVDFCAERQAYPAGQHYVRTDFVKPLARKTPLPAGEQIGQP